MAHSRRAITIPRDLVRPVVRRVTAFRFAHAGCYYLLVALASHTRSVCYPLVLAAFQPRSVWLLTCTVEFSCMPLCDRMLVMCGQRYLLMLFANSR